jgi:hypothetical protein
MSGWGHPTRPLFDNQLGHRLPTGGPPARGELSMLIALSLFLLSPITLLAWAAGQAVLRVTGIRWWKLALAALAMLGGVVWLQGGPGPALAHHFSGYLQWVRQYGAAELHLPMPGGVPVAAAPSCHPHRPAGRRTEPGRPAAGDRPR